MGAYPESAHRDPGKISDHVGVGRQGGFQREEAGAVLGVQHVVGGHPQAVLLGGLGKGKIPVQLFGDYKLHQKSSAFGEIEPQMKGAHVFADVRSILPKEIGDSIEEGVLAFGKKLKGFDRNDAILSGVESRTSSPVRIVRNREGYSNIEGIYPCGEGAGYAGGITSAAMDGIKTAEFICEKFRNF